MLLSGFSMCDFCIVLYEIWLFSGLNKEKSSLSLLARIFCMMLFEFFEMKRQGSVGTPGDAALALLEEFSRILRKRWAIYEDGSAMGLVLCKGHWGGCLAVCEDFAVGKFEPLFLASSLLFRSIPEDSLMNLLGVLLFGGIQNVSFLALDEQDL